MAILDLRSKLAILADAAKYDASCASPGRPQAGLGVRTVDRMLRLRRMKRLRLEDVQRLCRSAETVKPFIIADGWSPGVLADAEPPAGLETHEPAGRLPRFRRRSRPGQPRARLG